MRARNTVFQKKSEDLCGELVMNDDTAIKVEHVSKSFKLPHNKQSTIKGALVNLVGRGDRTYETQDVLKDVSFEIKKGEFFGIVGRNGSGKSTLLKMLAGIYTPTKGAISINGSLTPFIELGVGFNPELTGRENVYLNGALLGFNNKEMDAMYSDIVGFAELERFMDQKLKNYSSGMQVRLAFSIAIRARSDILVLDEVLAVGDASFQDKCFTYFESLKANSQTVILVTHDMAAVTRFCSRALLLENGIIKDIGNPAKIASQYTIDNFEQSQKQQSNQQLKDGVKKLDIKLEKSEYEEGGELRFDVLYELENDSPVDFGISILRDNVSLIEQNTLSLRLDYAPHKEHRITLQVPLDVLNPGNYRIDVAAFHKPEFKLKAFHVDAANFIIKQTASLRGGVLNIPAKWVNNHGKK